jgi:hypothetical protein
MQQAYRERCRAVELACIGCPPLAPTTIRQPK